MWPQHINQNQVWGFQYTQHIYRGPTRDFAIKTNSTISKRTEVTGWNLKFTIFLSSVFQKLNRFYLDVQSQIFYFNDERWDEIRSQARCSLFLSLCVFVIELLKYQLPEGGVCCGSLGSRTKCSDQVQISTLGSHLLTGNFYHKKILVFLANWPRRFCWLALLKG